MVTAEEEELSRLNIKYPLIPPSPKPGSKAFAYAHIFFSPETNEIYYYIVEPKLDEMEKKLLSDIKDYIQEKVDVNFAQVRKIEAVGHITKIFNSALEYFNVKIDEETRQILKYYVFRDFIGLERIEPFLKDKQIEDISCDGVNIPIYIYHRNPKLGSLKTNVQFRSREILDSFVNKIAERCGRSISVSKPLLDGTLPDGSRVQATLGSDIARHGSNFTMRMFTDKPLTTTDVIDFGTCDINMMAYLWFLVENNFSFLVCGGTATGKTSFLNVISLFIKPQMKIVSIEDTSELRLPHSHWVPEVARTPISEEGKVDMFELLRESLRQRPDYIIVGEVRGKEAYVLFQQMAVGHPGLSTIHSENLPKLIDRLTSPPISLPPNLIQNLDAIIFLKRVKKGRKYIRRVNSITEVIGFDRKNNTPVTNETFRWLAKTDKFKVVNKSFLLKKIADSTDLSEKEIGREIRKRASVIKWLVDNNIRDYKRIGMIFNLFYTNPSYLLKKIEGGI